MAGNAQRDQRNWEAALAYYLRGYEIAPNDDFLPGNAADMLNRLERYDEALPLSEVAISLDPDWLKWRRARIEALTRLGRGAEAVADADRAMARWPDSGPLHAERVNALIAAGQYDAALSACDRLIALDPDYRSWALFSRGEIYGHMKRHAESAMAFRQASASYQQNGKPQFQELSMQNALAAEEAAAAPRGFLSRLFGRR
ncbi:Beta-barrel assembly-enhancing protease [compost metagenome]